LVSGTLKLTSNTKLTCFYATSKTFLMQYYKIVVIS
jgi:hypothetical protein